MASADREVGFAAAGLAQEQDGPVLLDEAQGGEVCDEFGVDAGLELEVEVLDGLVERELRVAQPGCEAPVAGVDGLLVEESGQELDVGPLVLVGVFGEGGEDLRGSVELQVAEVGLDLLIESAAGAHRNALSLLME